MKDLIKRIFSRETKPKIELDENDREAFRIVARTFNFDANPENVDWRNAWGLSQDSGLSEKTVSTIVERYKGVYFDESPLVIAGSKFYRLTNEGFQLYNTLRENS
ncbi:MAG: hypothetical protein AABW51_01990 [Nanoarchaeota archaeon]